MVDKDYHKRYYERHRQEYMDRYYSLKTEVIRNYGQNCNCCGVGELSFLCIDHINGLNGEKRLTGSKLYRKMIIEGCPKDKYQILCASCNQSKSILGRCVHKL